MSLRARVLCSFGIVVILSLGACRGGTPQTATTPTATATPSPTKKAAPSRAGLYLVTAEGCLNVRATPSINGTFVVCVATGETVKADGAAKKADGHTWYHVSYKKMSGWAASEYLTRKPSS